MSSLSFIRRPTLLLFAAVVLAAPAATAEPKKKSTVDEVGETATNIVEKPMKDLNLKQEKIPPELQAIMNKPYALNGITSCADFSAAIAKLDSVLGPDVDSPKAQSKKGESSSEFVLSSVESIAGSLIPGSGLIRKVSGAEAAEKKAKAAVFAGSVRRAYLKGTARAKGCKV